MARNVALAVWWVVCVAGCQSRPAADAPTGGDPADGKTTGVVWPTSGAKVDLLFMIDDSTFMADKQQFLSGNAAHPGAVDDLLFRLANPRCVDVATQLPIDPAKQPASPTDVCPAGSARDFVPVDDVHIGVITSSLGTGGADTCAGASSSHGNDMAHLSTRTATGNVPVTYESAGFLFWDATGANGGVERYQPRGESDLGDVELTFRDMVSGTGEQGCTFESQLEAVYRFLADPAPYQGITLDRQGAVVFDGVDQTLLGQRAAFLRPDSVLVIVSLTDENDASLRVEQGQNDYLVYQAQQDGRPFRMYRPSSECDRDPASPCCTSCALPDVNGCTPHAEDPSCRKNGGQYDGNDPLDPDASSLRAWHQKQRFGQSFLWPAQRYVDMVLSNTVPDPSQPSTLQANPIYASLQGTNVSATRSTEDVFWAQIVGVPWQDIAVDPKDLSKGYLSTTPISGDPSGNDFVSRGVWDLVLGEPDHFKDPGDPLMIESIDPRSGRWQVTGNALVPPSSDPRTPPPVDTTKLANGHERNVSRRDDLQYACIFDLPKPRACSTDPASCDCEDMTGESQNPLCQDPATGKLVHTQFRGKAYPAIRELQVAKGLGAQGIVASICPANVTDASRADYGYRPAVDAIVARVKTRLKAQCLPRPLQENTGLPATDPASGQVACTVIEVTPAPAGGGDCPPCDASPGRTAASANDIAAITRAGAPSSLCHCALAQLAGGDMETCRTDANAGADGPELHGWCYVDRDAGGNAALVEDCAASEPRKIRFLGDDVPTKGAVAYLVCEPAAFAAPTGPF